MTDHFVDANKMVTDPARLRELRAERFVPWPLAKSSVAHVYNGGELHLTRPCTTPGFVSDARFGGGEVVKRTNRATTRKWRGLVESEAKRRGTQ